MVAIQPEIYDDGNPLDTSFAIIRLMRSVQVASIGQPMMDAVEPPPIQQPSLSLDGHWN